jgi:uncharacterized membrane protein HdeD (DUF308 family)
MTDPQVGPPDGGRTGASTGSSSGPSPAEDRGSSRGASWGAAGPVSAPQATAAPAAVPQQYEPRQDAGPYQGEPGTGAEPTAMRGDTMLAAAARQSWPAVLVGALGLIALGIMLLVWPHASLTVVAILIGAALLVSGVVRLWEGFTASQQSGGMRAAYMVIGLLAVLAGLYCLRHHALSLFLVAFVTGVYFIAHGISDLGVAMSGGVPGRGLRAVLGVFSLAAGIIMVIWPAITLVLLLTIVAAWLLFYGIVLAGLAFSLFRVGRAAARNQSVSRRRVAGSTA